MKNQQVLRLILANNYIFLALVTKKCNFQPRLYCKQLQKAFSIACLATRSKAWACGLSLAGIAGSNLAGCIYVYVLLMLCVVR